MHTITVLAVMITDLSSTDSFLTAVDDSKTNFLSDLKFNPFSNLPTSISTLYCHFSLGNISLFEQLLA